MAVLFNENHETITTTIKVCSTPLLLRLGLENLGKALLLLRPEIRAQLSAPEVVFQRNIKSAKQILVKLTEQL